MSIKKSNEKKYQLTKIMVCYLILGCAYLVYCSINYEKAREVVEHSEPIGYEYLRVERSGRYGREMIILYDNRELKCGINEEIFDSLKHNMLPKLYYKPKGKYSLRAWDVISYSNFSFYKSKCKLTVIIMAVCAAIFLFAYKFQI